MEEVMKRSGYGESCGEVIAIKDDEQFDNQSSPRTKMEEMREENRKLKIYLDQITKDYESLQTKLNETKNQEPKNSKEAIEESDHQLVSLSLGRSKRSMSSNGNLDQETAKPSNSIGGTKKEDHKVDGESMLALGLDCKLELSNKPESTGNGSLSVNPSYGNSSESKTKEEGEEGAVTWPPSKVLKTLKSEDVHQHHDQNTGKKPRVSVRARCDAPTINDGCQWRKYGQKTAKGNPCPRAYYRCTVAPSCPVRKHVQRCPEDMSILITTYEGTHNHPLPMSATAMASTTSAAASMLVSGATSSSSASNLHGLNLYLSNNSSLKPNQFYVPNSSTSHPTITIDLANSLTNQLPFPSSTSSLFSQFSSNSALRAFPASSSSLSFGNSSVEAKETFSWGSNNSFRAGSGTNNSAAQTLPYTMYNPNLGSTHKIGNHSNAPHQSLFQKTNLNTSFQQSLPPETIKAITTNPNFRSALAAALTSVIGNGSGDQDRTKSDHLKLKRSTEPFSNNNLSDNHLAAAARNNSFGLSLANKSSTSLFSSSYQPWNLINTRPSLHFKGSKGSNASAGDAREPYT